MPQPSPLGLSQGSKSLIAMRPSAASLSTGVCPPTLTCMKSQHLSRDVRRDGERTIVPLLKNPPEAQNESDRTLSADAVLVSKFHRAPHAGCPSSDRGSFVALSKKIASVGETTIASSARIPDVPF